MERIKNLILDEPIEIVVENLLKNSFMTNIGDSFFMVEDWAHIPINNPYPIVSVRADDYEFDQDYDYVDMTVNILIEKPDLDTMYKLSKAVPVDFIYRHSVWKHAKEYVAVLYEVGRYLTGREKLPNGKTLSNLSLSGRAVISIYYGGWEEYNRLILRGRGEEDTLSDSIIILEMKIRLKHSRTLSNSMINRLNPS